MAEHITSLYDIYNRANDAGKATDIQSNDDMRSVRLPTAWPSCFTQCFPEAALGYRRNTGWISAFLRASVSFFLQCLKTEG